MKNLLLILTLCSYAISQNLEMPPPIPSMEQQKPKKDSNKVQKNGCESIPPMLHMLPPPLQNSLDKCQIQKFMPNTKQVKKYLKTNKIKYKSINISPAKDFIRVYRIDLGNGKRLFCNETVTRCLKP